MRDATTRLRRTLGEAKFNEESHLGAAMTLRQSVAYAADQVDQALRVMSERS
jgi:hypothetical protein